MDAQLFEPRPVTVAELCQAIASGRVRTTRRGDRYEVQWGDILDLARADAPLAIGSPIVDWSGGQDYWGAV